MAGVDLEILSCSVGVVVDVVDVGGDVGVYFVWNVAGDGWRY